jgi:hypothetical protein
VDVATPDKAIQHLGEALTLLARRPELRVFLSHGALARAGNSFSWGSQIKRMNELYYELQPSRDRRASQ